MVNVPPQKYVLAVQDGLQMQQILAVFPVVIKNVLMEFVVDQILVNVIEVIFKMNSVLIDVLLIVQMDVQMVFVQDQICVFVILVLLRIVQSKEVKHALNVYKFY